jgi:hypothetical protein
LEELTMHKNFLKRKSTPVTINGYTMWVERTDSGINRQDKEIQDAN